MITYNSIHKRTSLFKPLQLKIRDLYKRVVEKWIIEEIEDCPLFIL
jgi:hypothetical protein